MLYMKYLKENYPNKVYLPTIFHGHTDKTTPTGSI